MLKVSRRSFLSASASAGLIWGGGLSSFANEDGVSAQTNPFLSGHFAPVADEISADRLKVIGKLPDDLNGMFLRNGPNPQVPPKNNYHMFEGDGMLHGVRLQDGQASYRNRWVRTAAWHEEREAGEALYASILDPPDLKAISQQILSGKMPFPNRANTALIWHHGKLLALWEGGPPHEIDVPGLDTVGLNTFGGKLRHAFTAHPKIDPKTGEMMFFGYSPFPPYLQYSVADRDGRILNTTPVALPRPVMMHDMAITEKHTLFLDVPGVLNLSGLISGQPMFQWAPEHGAHIGILPRHANGGVVRWFEIKPCFIFHVFNAFEEGDEIQLYACRYPKYPAFVDLNAPADGGSAPRKLAEVNSPVPYRWNLNLKTGDVKETQLDDVWCEFPRVDDRLAGSKTRFGYACGETASAMLKFDLEQGSVERHTLGKGRSSGEGVFVRRSGSKREDDGYLISFAHDIELQQSEMLVIDCSDMAAPPLARVLMPRRVPFGFHGIWLDDSLL